jgi:hypothetical protein
MTDAQFRSHVEGLIRRINRTVEEVRTYEGSEMHSRPELHAILTALGDGLLGIGLRPDIAARWARDLDAHVARFLSKQESPAIPHACEKRAGHRGERLN